MGHVGAMCPRAWNRVVYRVARVEPSQAYLEGFQVLLELCLERRRQLVLLVVSLVLLVCFALEGD